MRIFDKFLLLLLIVLMPLGVFLSTKYLSQKEGSASTSQDPETIKKLEELIAQVGKAQESGGRDTDRDFQITSAVYASNSGILTVAGVAPLPGVVMRLSWAEIKDETIIPELGGGSLAEDMVLANANAKALMPRGDGSFSILVPITIDHGIIDILLQQQRILKSVQYDIDSQKLTE